MSESDWEEGVGAGVLGGIGTSGSTWVGAGSKCINLDR